MSKSQKWLLGLTIAFLAAAEIMKRVHMEERAMVVVGLVEVLIAVALGIAFGVATTKKTERK